VVCQEAWVDGFACSVSDRAGRGIPFLLG
jgi:hypothetical protein